MTYSRFGGQLTGVSRCPHCSVANPVLQPAWQSPDLTPRALAGASSRWGVFICTTCGFCLLARGAEGDHAQNAPVIEVLPAPKAAHEDIPDPARTFLQQAFDTLHAPDAAAVMAGSAVDSMLKTLNLKEGSLYSRIDKAVEHNHLTSAMGDWAHEVRLGSNRPRHADQEKPHVTQDEAKQSVEFAEALGYFLFVLTKRIERGKEAAKKASSTPAP